MNGATGRAALIALLLAQTGATFAAQHTLPTRRFLVRNPGGGSSQVKRKIVFTEEDQLSAIPLVGDPTVSGATLRVSLGDGDEQCFAFPAAAWSSLGPLGFKYHDTQGLGAAVNATIEKEVFSGDVILKWKLRGAKGPLTVVPQAGTPSFAVNFRIGDGDEYCAGGPTPSGGTSTDVVYQVGYLPAPSTCGVPACSPSGAFLDFPVADF
jgi:hypothetical protein